MFSFEANTSGPQSVNEYLKTVSIEPKGASDFSKADCVGSTPNPFKLFYLLLYGASWFDVFMSFNKHLWKAYFNYFSSFGDKGNSEMNKKWIKIPWRAWNHAEWKSTSSDFNG